MSDQDEKRAKKAAPEGGKKADGAKKPECGKKAEGGKKAKADAAPQAVAVEEVRDPNYVPRFKQRYNDVVRPQLAGRTSAARTC